MKDIDKELDTILGGLENSVETYIVKRQNGGNPKSPKTIHLEAKQAIKQLIDQARVDELEKLLSDDGQCICQLANQEVCDHNWSLCNTVKDRLKELKGE